MPTANTRIPDRVLPSILAGLSSGIAGALLFATAHALLIVPIWTRMWSGLAWGALAGAAATWALIELYPGFATLSTRSTASLGARFGALLWLLVTPVSVVGAALRAWTSGTGDDLIEVPVAVTLALGGGATFAWLRTRRWRPTIACALATLALTIAMAGPVPIERGRRALGIFVAVLPAAIVAGCILALLVRRVNRVAESTVDHFESGRTRTQ